MTKSGSPDMAYRILIVDDSLVARNAMRHVVEKAGLSSQVEMAVDGQHALRIIARMAMRGTPIEIVLLDIEMPVMDGITALPKIVEVEPAPRVIMSSALTRRGAAISFEALSLGASDYVCKPSSKEGLFGPEFHRELSEKVICWGRLARRTADTVLAPRTRPERMPADAVASADSKAERVSSAATPQSPHSTQAPVRHPGDRAGSRAGTAGTLRTRANIKAFAIGCSTGGPQALLRIFRDGRFPLHLPIFLTQHMPPTFTTILAEQLARTAGCDSHEGVDGEPVSPGTIYVAPGDRHMLVRRDRNGDLRIRLDDGPPRNFCRPAVDPMLESLAEVYGADLCTIILTGMGHDGAHGCEKARGSGGAILVQDAETSVVWGMPGAVADRGLVDAILPLDEIPGQAARLLGTTMKERRRAS